jgi:hypothetical protein
MRFGYTIVFLLLTSICRAAEPGAIQFNRDVRPILSDKCYACHGPDPAQRKTKFRFDQEDGAKSVIIAGDAAASKLIQRITSDNPAIRMPPAYQGRDKLSPSEIQTLRRWVEQGAKWEAHWSFIAPKRPELPSIKDRSWPSNPIDSFVLARLEREGLHPSLEADRRTLIRRVSLDLTGLPPAPAEVDAFLGDASPHAWEHVVDRLLASPRYAERMATRWLDAARYSDTNGYQSDGERSMWRWRDWVIDAFDHNMPFDQFTIEQIAGDLLPNATASQKIATGFHRNHRTNAEGGIVPEEFRVEYVADRVETTSIVWLGLTMGCARCHDHKYDPIRQRDFYRMFAFFNNVPEKGLVYNFGNDEPMMKAPTPEQSSRLGELEAKLREAEKSYNALEPSIDRDQAKWERRAAHKKKLDWSPHDGLVVDRPQPVDFDGETFVDVGDVANFDYLDPFTLAASIHPSSPDGAILTRVEDYFEGEGYGLYLINGKVRLHIIKRWTDIGLRVETENPIPLNEWSHVSATYDGYRYASGVRIYVNGQPQKLKVLFDDLNYPLGAKDPFRIGGGGGPKLRFQGSIRGVEVFKRAVSEAEASILALNQTIGQLAAIPPAQRTKPQSDKLALCFLDRFASKKVQAARQQMFDARAERKRYYEAIPTVMVMQDTPTPRDTFILKRGAYDNHGEQVSPGVPGFLPPFQTDWPNNRLGLARWLVSPANPLTARVIVNRFWQMYFGTGLVKTIEDFGSQGEASSHPELLDWLATEFVESGWDMKAIQKAIVLSSTYRQSSKVTHELWQLDPENRLLARGPRFRLSPEMIRDQALAVSGLLVEKAGGPSVKPYQPPGLWQELAGGSGYVQDHGSALYRRSLYTYWKRTVAPPSMVNFDASTRETCTVREVRTNTPLQALDLMNDVAYVEAARKLAERLLTEGGNTPIERLTYAYRLVLARAPKPAEEKILLATLDELRKRYAGDLASATKLVAEGESPHNPKLNIVELAVYTSAASLLLNLDETITKE